MCSRRSMAVRGLRCEFKGFRGDAALPHCCDRRAFLLAFIFSRRFTRWLLVISISSILSRAVRSCEGTEGRRYTQPARALYYKMQCLRLYLSLKFPFFCFKFVFYFLRVVCWCLVPGHLPFKSVNLEKKQQWSTSWWLRSINSGCNINFFVHRPNI